MGFAISLREFNSIRLRHEQGESIRNIARTESRSKFLIQKVLNAREYADKREVQRSVENPKILIERRSVRMEILRQRTRSVQTTARRIATQSGVGGLTKIDVLYRVKALELKPRGFIQRLELLPRKEMSTGSSIMSMKIGVLATIGGFGLLMRLP
ncbi:hypothetical protein Ciccas_008890 [Cichlidogyrus casuarinus]|uniref:Uncharacterized protein n=1 Tax=Cichlidogyrus casuarinus TaxID=1844966 RepID=A0ABD2Q2Y9_9PLAT